MKRTSRRTFGKQLTGAIAAFPLASLARSASGQSQQNTKDQKARKDQVEAKFYHENTPPPVSFEEGSLRIHVRGNKELDEPPLGPQARYVYTADFRPTPSSGSNEITHLRILSGNGDILYSNTNARGLWIKLDLQQSNGDPAGDLKIRGGSLFTVDSNARLTPPLAASGPNLTRIYHHPGAGAVRIRVKSIRVTMGDPQAPESPVHFLVDLGSNVLPFSSQEFRVLIWPH